MAMVLLVPRWAGEPNFWAFPSVVSMPPADRTRTPTSDVVAVCVAVFATGGGAVVVVVAPGRTSLPDGVDGVMGARSR